MKNYKTLKEMPLIPKGTVFTLSRWLNEYRILKEGKLKDYVEWDRVCGSTYLRMLNSALAVWWRLKEVTKPSYIVTEEGEIIGEYEGDCWYVNLSNKARRARTSRNNEIMHFLTEEQAKAYIKRQEARRELRQLYYENGCEENKGMFEVVCNWVNGWYIEEDDMYIFKTITNKSIPHCERKFHEDMLELPRVQDLYKIIFGISE